MSNFSIAETRKRERARLSNLFEQLSGVSPRLPQLNAHPEITSNISSSKNQTPSIPEEFSTALRNLSVIRTPCRSETRHPRTRRNTVAFMSSSSAKPGVVTSSQGNDNDRGFDEFRLAEENKYPFTFKHMIHKLYKKDDWLRTVKEVLEKSKKDFKPLAECALIQNPPEWLDPNIKLKDVAHLRTAKRAGGTVKPRDSWNDKLGVNEPPEGGESLRALKKRCVGIRKSISGRPSRDGAHDVPNETRESGKGGAFVFASTVSSTERPGKEIYLHFPSPQVSPSDSCFSDAGQDLTTPHSPVSPITPTWPVPLNTSCTAGMKRRVGIDPGVLVLNAVPPRRLKEGRLSAEVSPQRRLT